MSMAEIANNKTETVRFAQDAINIFNDIQKVYRILKILDSVCTIEGLFMIMFCMTTEVQR